MHKFVPSRYVYYLQVLMFTFVNMLRHDQRISVIGTFIVSRWISRRVWASYRHPGELSPAESDLIERERVREMAELLLSVATCSYQKTWTIWICSITPVPILSQTYHQPLITRYQSSLRISKTEIQLSAGISSQWTFYGNLGWLIKLSSDCRKLSRISIEGWAIAFRARHVASQTSAVDGRVLRSYHPRCADIEGKRTTPPAAPKLHKYTHFVKKLFKSKIFFH
jgi:hypothetical protein